MAALSEVQQFVTSCGRFSEGFVDDNKATTQDHISTLQEITQVRMPQEYSMPFPEVSLVQQQPGDKDKERHLRGLWHELAQHLRDLRYLTEKVFRAYHHEDNKNRILADPALLQPVLAAVKKYLPEEKEWDELEKILPTGRSIDLFWLGKHLSTLVDRIGLHTCWDGSILIPKKYKVGEKTVFGRALAFRLRTLSSKDYKFSARTNYYTAQDNETLNKLFSEGFTRPGKATKTDIPRGFWTALGDIDDLVVSYVHNIPDDRNLTMLYQLARLKKKSKPEVNDQIDGKLELIKANWEEPDKKDGQIKVSDLKDSDIKLVQANWKEYDKKKARSIVKSVRRQKNRRSDSLDLRLLQIKLWQAGYYTGAIDGKWQEVSHQALKVFLLDDPLTTVVVSKRKKERKEDTKKKVKALNHKWNEEKKTLKTGSKARKKRRKEKNDAISRLNHAEKQANEKDDEALKEARRVRSLLLIVNRGHRVYAADFKAILEHLGVDLRKRAKSINVLGEAELINELQNTPGVDQDAFDEKILREEGVGKLYPDNYKKPKRRVSFFRKVGGFIVGGLTKIAKWLAEAAQKAVEFVLGPVFSFVKKLLRPIRAAIHRFFQGFKYLTHFVFGRPLFTETAPATTTKPPRVFATKFQLDFDAINFVPGGFGPEEPGQHASHIQRMQEDMAYFIDGVIWVIKAIGKLSNPGGWVWLGWQIMKCIAGGVPGLGALWPQGKAA